MKKLIVNVDDQGVYHVEGELIQCKDCSKNGTSDCAMGRWIYSDNKVFWKEHWNKEDDYCSWSKRKAE